jgi:hypothetical protein
MMKEAAAKLAVLHSSEQALSTEEGEVSAR